MRKHVSLCRENYGAHLEKIHGTVIVDPAVRSHHETIPRVKPGPKPVDLSEALRGRIPAFDDGDDERIDYIFAHGLIEDLLTMRCDDIPLFLFNALWSKQAPEHMHSLVLYRCTVYEVTELDDETGNVEYSARCGLTKRFAKEMAVYTLELAYAIAKDSVPARIPERTHDAMHLLSRLQEATFRQFTLRDMLKDGCPSVMRPRIEALVNTLYDAMKASLPTCFT